MQSLLTQHVLNLSTQPFTPTHVTTRLGSTQRAQYTWLLADLQFVNRSVTPWVLLMCHRPMYVNSAWRSGYNSDISMMNKLIKHLEPLLYRYKVNLAFYGHYHAVQRSSAVLNGTVRQHARVANTSVDYYGDGHAVNVSTASYVDPPVGSCSRLIDALPLPFVPFLYTHIIVTHTVVTSSLTITLSSRIII